MKVEILVSNEGQAFYQELKIFKNRKELESYIQTLYARLNTALTEASIKVEVKEL